MRPNRIVRLGVIALVIGAVAAVLHFKQSGSPSVLDDPSAAVDHAVLPARVSESPHDLPAAEVARPRLLDLGADKCIPCKKMAPMLVALRQEFAGEFEVVFIDVWKDRQAARTYGISLIPTQIFFDEAGSELFRHQGFFSREDILAAWSDLGYPFGASREDEAG